jgi:hypothetical protein
MKGLIEYLNCKAFIIETPPIIETLEFKTIPFILFLFCKTIIALTIEKDNWMSIMDNLFLMKDFSTLPILSK